jgi:hypothetical protein
MKGLRRAFAGALIGLGATVNLAAAQSSSPDNFLWEALRSLLHFDFAPRTQNWTPGMIEQWYAATQGSRLLPYSWLVALEQAENRDAFLDEANIEKFRYLPRQGQLPVGFAIDNTDDETLSVGGRRAATQLRWKSGQGSREEWVGFTCSACHTEEITYRGARLHIEGGPARADFQGFIEALERAVDATRRQSEKFERFAGKVLGAENTADNQARLRRALDQWIDGQLKLERLNCDNLHDFRCDDIRYGYGRLDAFGHIFNKVEAISRAGRPHGNPANAPVRYPVLWNVPQENFTQWNASVQKKSTLTLANPFDFGALARNSGEVIGVYGDIEPVAKSGSSGFKSSVQIDTLVAFELMLGDLHAPEWPSMFGAPDLRDVAAGERLYQAKCARCHAVLERGDLATPIDVKPEPIKPEEQTDLLMACNAALDRSVSGVLQGTKEFILWGRPLGATALSSHLLDTIVMGVILGKKVEIAGDAIGSWLGFAPRPVVAPPKFPTVGGALNETAAERTLAKCRSKGLRLVYKARPLNGVWAAAPYLHNGSVPTLDDLLRAPACRPTEFWLGTRDFDPDRVGYVSTKDYPKNDFLFDTSLPGNSNEGHDYGASKFTDAERKALIAYLKTL